jgi:hypothetical protein
MLRSNCLEDHNIRIRFDNNRINLTQQGLSVKIRVTLISHQDKYQNLFLQMKIPTFDIQ